MEPTLLTVCAIMSPRSAAHFARWADDHWTSVSKMTFVRQRRSLSPSDTASALGPQGADGHGRWMSDVVSATAHQRNSEVTMRTVCLTATVGGIALIAVAAALAQDRRTETNACLVGLIQDRIESRQSVRVAADEISLTRDTLRLVGHAWVRFSDTSIRSDEIVWNQDTKRIDLIGNVNAFLGSATGCADPPRIEFR